MGIMLMYCGGFLGNKVKFLSFEVDKTRNEYGIGGIFIAMGVSSIGLIVYLCYGKIFKNEDFSVKFIPKKSPAKVFPITN